MEGSSCDNPWPYLNFTGDSRSSLGESVSSTAFPIDPDLQTLVLPCQSADDVQWSLESLSASAGLSIADFATQISATAEMALKHMEAGEDLHSLKHLSMGTPTPNVFRPSWDNQDPVVHWPASSDGLSGIQHSTNGNGNPEQMWDYSWTGVNPADILPNFNLSPSVSYGSGGSEARVFSRSITSSMSNESIFGQDFDFQANMVSRSIASHVPLPPAENASVPDMQDARNGSDDEHSLYKTSSSSEYSPPPEFFMVKRDATRVKRRKVTRNRNGSKEEQESLAAEDPIEDSHPMPLNLGTPVLDAHRGISIEELKAKAERYRLRNQGRDYDKRWLISFAGKLSARGELITEFRCYVSGCKQTNKRRDHILIHVGAHLDQRPFKCLHCTSRFLRKNECKRHELSHSGVRPFSCHLCPHPATTFVRQDLLKRHMKRTHHVDLKSDKENNNSGSGSGKSRGKKRTKF
ncbi:hypothetical protein CVT24_009595 [Panaeolus cyanescens]|uniref:C2H2-type domain-containing protein n=1 Tax=Panaeolus cyanescens TaxID=181874 RepID=A0A409YA82_9AGAR|nr:hypothetical protein CVT24_009595 [Panaeolus cyanescens]